MTSLPRETGRDDLDAAHIQAFPLGGKVHNLYLPPYPQSPEDPPYVPLTWTPDNPRCCLIQIACSQDVWINVPGMGESEFMGMTEPNYLRLRKDVLYTYGIAPGTTMTFSGPPYASFQIVEAA